MGIREFYAQYMNRPGYEYRPDPLGRLGQGKWVKTAQGPEVPKPVPPTPPKGVQRKSDSAVSPQKTFRRFRLRNGRIIDEDGNDVPLDNLSKKERAWLFREWQLQNLKNTLD